MKRSIVKILGLLLLCQMNFALAQDPELQAMKSIMAIQQGQLADKQKQLDEKQAQINTLNNELTAAKQVLNELKNTMTQLKQDVANVQNNSSGSVSEVNTKLDNFINTVNSANYLKNKDFWDQQVLICYYDKNGELYTTNQCTGNEYTHLVNSGWTFRGHLGYVTKYVPFIVGPIINFPLFPILRR